MGRLFRTGLSSVRRSDPAPRGGVRGAGAGAAAGNCPEWIATGGSWPSGVARMARLRCSRRMENTDEKARDRLALLMNCCQSLALCWSRPKGGGARGRLWLVMAACRAKAATCPLP